ncbi:MAG: response regulator [Myxococcota bacterium]
MSDDTQRHATLRSQLRRVGLTLSAAPDAEQWAHFVREVEATYNSLERDRRLLERSSHETRELHSALERDRDMLSMTLSTLMLSVVHVDADWKIVFTNPAAAAVLGASIEALKGEAFFEWVEVVGRDGMVLERGLFDRLLTRGQRWWEDECTLVMRRGGRLSVNLAFNPMLRDGELSGVVISIEDVTERMRVNAQLADARVDAQAAAQAAKAQSEFLANMSHELRTPLNTIIGYAELLREEFTERAEDARTSDVERIHTAGRHLLSLINDVLDMSKIQAGRLSLEVIDVSIEEIVGEVRATIEPLIAKNGNAFVTDVPDDIGEMVTDPTRLRQALLNLVSNAAKFTREGTITLRVRAEGADALSFEVADTGIGIPAGQLGRLFEAFRQADVSTTRRYGGTGLGLTITQSIVEAMGGRISVASEVGVGSSFRIELFRDTSPSEVTSAKTELGGALRDVYAHQALARTNRDARQRILLIDDDPACHDLLGRYLHGQNVALSSAYEGQQGLDMARRLLPDAIMLDVQLPDMDGWSVLGRLKSDPLTRNIPLVMVSILAEQHTAFQLGAQDYLVKPIDRDILRAMLERFRARVPTRSVMVVEDDDALREMLQRRLERDEMVVETAIHGLDALRKLELMEEPPSVILLDLMMPEMDGFEFLEQLHARAEFASIPVVVITAMELTDEPRERLSRYVERIIHKGDGSGVLRQVMDILQELIALIGAPSHLAM